MANQTSYKTELIKMRKKVFDTIYARIDTLSIDDLIKLTQFLSFELNSDKHQHILGDLVDALTDKGDKDTDSGDDGMPRITYFMDPNSKI